MRKKNNIIRYGNPKFKVIYINNGIANRLPGNVILINKNLLNIKYYPLLLEIVEHEIKHTSEGYKRSDFLLDIKGFKHSWLYTKFILTNPSAWLQFSPIWHYKGKWYWDWSVFFLYVFILIFCSVLVKWMTIRL